MYDPTVGQFVSQDPIGFDGKDTNLKRYVGNNPTNYTDPTGLEKCPVCDGTKEIPNPMTGTSIGPIDGVMFRQVVPPPKRCTHCQQRFSPEYFSKHYINPDTYERKDWGFESRLENMRYAQGCVGISKVSIDLENNYTPEEHPDSHWFLTYGDSMNYYNKLRNAGKSPMLIMRMDETPITLECDEDGKSSLVGLDSIIDNNELNPKKFNVQPGLFDYCLLANIDIGEGKEPCWLSASGGWARATGWVYATRVNYYSDPRRPIYIVIEDAGRPGMAYDVNFEIPEIPHPALPKSQEEFLLPGGYGGPGCPDSMRPF